MTPPGSACSVVIGEGLPLGAPGSVKGVQRLVVEDPDAVREQLAGWGVGISEIQQLGPEGTPGSRFAFFEDPTQHLGRAGAEALISRGPGAGRTGLVGSRPASVNAPMTTRAARGTGVVPWPARRAAEAYRVQPATVGHQARTSSPSSP